MLTRLRLFPLRSAPLGGRAATFGACPTWGTLGTFGTWSNPARYRAVLTLLAQV